MDYFDRHDGILHADGVDVRKIAVGAGTPSYVYSAATLQRHARVMQEAMGNLPHILCYAVKANGNLALLEWLAQTGCGVDAVSVGELVRVSRSGGDLARTIMSGVGKSDYEIACALRAGCLYICIESAPELDAVIRVARQVGIQAQVTVRVNPDVDPKTHPYISTGLRKNKFGVLTEEALALYERGQASEHVTMNGISCHIGSQITELEPFRDAAIRVVELARRLIERGIPLRHMGMGGGLGIPYADESPPSPKVYGETLRDLLGPLGLTVILEPGRVIVGNAAIVLTRVVRIKTHGTRRFAILDVGMNDLIRPALYQARHRVVPVEDGGDNHELYDVVGPVCESADTFALDCELPALREGSLLALRSAGAYSFVLASNYNGRRRPAEVFCRDGQWQTIRERETFSDLMRGERRLDGSSVDQCLPSFLDEVMK